MLALAEYEAGVCACGFHTSIASEDPYFTIEERVCPVCAQATAEIRARERADAESVGANDGRTRYLRLLLPSEIAAAKSVAK